MRSVTVKELERWLDHGASLRPLELGEREAVVELCTCYGEAVDVVRAEGPEAIRLIERRNED